MYLLEVEPLDLGVDIRAVGLELVEPASHEPVRGADAARVWSGVLPTVAGAEPWGLDFFSHLERLRDFCDRHTIPYRQAAGRCLVISRPEPASLVSLLERFEGETFGARAGSPFTTGDPQLETDLARRGADAYHRIFSNYLFCAVCEFESGSLTLLTQRLWASEVIRRVRPVLGELAVEVRLPT